MFSNDFFLTEAAGEESARQVLERAAKWLAERRIQPIQERLYGELGEREEILAIREEVFARAGLDPRTPVTYLEGKPISGAGMAGLQIWGIASNGSGAVEIRTIGSARLWEGRGIRLLYLPMVCGTGADGKLPGDPSAQAERMFANAAEILKAHGFSYRHVARTWIYLARLLDWYDDFNRVRTARYAKEGFGTGPGELPYPASTAIQGRHGEEECCMSLLALDVTPSSGAVVHAIRRSRRQDQAFSYGSAFSRAASIAMDGRKTIHISGTASIDVNGKTIHVGDPDLQAQETLLNVAALLEEQGGGLANIRSSTLFCKTREVHDTFRGVMRRLLVPAFPIVPMIADVCRPDLLVELEAVAVI
ncbi:MAG: hypothetical protein A2Z34_11250 [Planctomycetes bacterium RBG_16_59_8]|nr:MAG: hypothetical protein A2Z34_11250 [Planctomycetes bacterium RBG_16_59_8]